MENKDSYTPQEVFEIARVYTQFIKSRDSTRNTSDAAKKLTYAETALFNAERIPQNIIEAGRHMDEIKELEEIVRNSR